jgi:hypothetical protein
MNQFGCKQLKSTVILGFKTLAIGFFTGTVEKAVSFQAETIVQLRTCLPKNSPKNWSVWYSLGTKTLPYSSCFTLERPWQNAVTSRLSSWDSAARLDECFC